MVLLEKLVACALLLVVAQSSLAQVNKVRPGLGENPGEPQTVPLQLPPGVRLDGPIIGADADGGECKDKNVTVGSGQGVRVCAAFCMDQTMIKGADGTMIDIRNGLILVSQFRDGQNGLLLERAHINMPWTPCGGGGVRDDEDENKKRRKFIVEFNLQCLNEKRSPSFDKMEYRLAGITTDPDLLELLAILDTKKIETDEHHEIVGEAVYSITEGTGLTAGDRAALARLPDKSST